MRKENHSYKSSVEGSSQTSRSEAHSPHFNAWVLLLVPGDDPSFQPVQTLTTVDCIWGILVLPPIWKAWMVFPVSFSSTDPAPILLGTWNSSWSLKGILSLFYWFFPLCPSIKEAQFKINKESSWWIAESINTIWNTISHNFVFTVSTLKLQLLTT